MDRTRARAVALTLAGVVTAPALAACSSLDAGPDLPDLPTITQAWEAEDVEAYAESAWAEPAVWASGDLLVSVGGPFRENRVDVVALDRGTGEAAWSADLEGSLCSISPDVTDAGLGAVLYRPSSEDECVGVAAVDTSSGDVVWTTDLDLPGTGGRDGQAIVPDVGVGETSVNVTAGCGRVTRLDVADGTVLETLGRLPGGFGCTGPGGVGGHLVAYTDGRGADAEQVLLDTDRSGVDAEVWRRPARGVVEDIPSTSPLLLDVSDGDGRLLRTGASDPGATVGLRMNPSGTGGFIVAARAGDVVVGRYDGEEDQLLAYDTATGEQLWERPEIRYDGARHLVGERDGELIWIQPFSDPDAPGEDRLWVSASDPRDPGAGRTLGAIDVGFGPSGDGQWDVEGDLLLGLGSSGVTAYPLDGVDDDAVDGVAEVPAGFVDDLDDDLAWTADDVRPADALGACREVAPATLAELGLRTDLPAPVDCGWSGTESAGAVRLDVDLMAVEAGQDEGAAEVASRNLGDAPLPGAPTREVDLGDEALMSTLGTDPLTGPDPTVDLGSGLVALVVRRGNVVVRVDLASGGPSDGPSDGLRVVVPTERLETLAARAADDVLDGLDLDAGAVPAGEDGPVTEAPTGGCDPGPALRRLVPGGETRRGEPSDDGRQTVCERRPPRDPYPDAQLQVTADAVTPGLGTSAVEAATARMDALTGEEVSGVGDQAVLVSGTDFDRTQSLVARRGNLVVVVVSETDDRTVLSDRLTDLRQVASRMLRRGAAGPG